VLCLLTDLVVRWRCGREHCLVRICELRQHMPAPVRSRVNRTGRETLHDEVLCDAGGSLAGTLIAVVALGHCFAPVLGG
jgi:hypothetical protein